MMSSGAIGLAYTVAKDLLRLRRPEQREVLIVELNAVSLGSTIHLRLTVYTKPGTAKVTIQRVTAIRKQPYVGCARAGDDLSFPELRFRPVRPDVRTVDETTPAEWVATLDANRVRHLRAADERTGALEVFGENHVPDLEGAPPGSFIYALEGEDQMEVAAIVVTSRGTPAYSNVVKIPPLPPLTERLTEWWVQRRQRRKEAPPAAPAPPVSQ